MTSVIKNAVSLNQEDATMNRKSFFVGILAAGCFIVSLMLMPNAASAQADPKVAKAMKLLKAKTAKLGAPKIEGKDAVEGKDVPALYFGKTKMNNNFKVVDEVVRKAGGTATLFVKAGDDDYVRDPANAMQRQLPDSCVTPWRPINLAGDDGSRRETIRSSISTRMRCRAARIGRS
jgi:hypothetical protein